MAESAKHPQAQSAQRTERMGTEKITKLLWEFGVPATVGIVVNALYNIVDSIFIGRGVGELGIAAATASFPPMLLMMAFGMLVGGGGNALMAIKLGEKDYVTSERILSNALTLMIIISALVTGLGLIFMEPVLRISGADAAVMPYAKDYLSIIYWGMIFQCIGFGMNNFIRTTGSPKRAMVTMLTGAVVNIVLDYLFIIKMGMGVKGAAFATIIGQAVNAVIVLQYFLGKKSPIRLHTGAMKLRLSLVKSILALGAASFAMQVAASIVNIVLNSSLTRYGAHSVIGSSGGLAAMGVVSKIAQFFVLPVMGIVVAAQPLIGYNFGAQQFDRVKEAFIKATIGSTIYLTFFWILIEAFPAPLVALFGLKKAAISNFASVALRYYLLLMPVIGFQMIASNYFQATGQPAKSAFFTLSRQVVFLIPAIYLAPVVAGALGADANGQLIAIAIAAPVSDFLSTLLVGVFVAREFRHLDARHARTLEEDSQPTAA